MVLYWHLLNTKLPTVFGDTYIYHLRGGETYQSKRPTQQNKDEGVDDNPHPPDLQPVHPCPQTQALTPLLFSEVSL